MAEETSDLMRLKQPDGQMVEVPIKEIDDRSRENSAISSLRRPLTPDDMRNLIGFLAESPQS